MPALVACVACGRHVFRADGACPHCGHQRDPRPRSLPSTAKVSVVAVVIGVGALGGAACSSTVSDSNDGGGGAGGDGGAASTGSATQKTTATTAKSTGQSTAQQTTVTTIASSYGSGPTTTSGGCDNQGNCEGDGSNPYSGCMECAVLGNSNVATDGGACADEFAACFGDGSPECGGAGDPECCQFYDCVDACDTNGDGEIDEGLELDCLCTHDGLQCLPDSLPGTCRGDFTNGLQTAIGWESCLYQDVCPTSCSN